MDNRYRSYDGAYNNLQKPFWGKIGCHLLRDAPLAYADNSAEMAERVRSKTGENIPNPRDVSNTLCQRPRLLKTKNNGQHQPEKGVNNAQTNDQPSEKSVHKNSGLSDFMWVWSQFLEHELVLLDTHQPREVMDISVMQGDPVFEWGGSIPFSRSRYDPATGSGVNNPRQQVNGQTAFLDGSSIYGTDVLRAAALRRFDGTGRLKCSESLHGDLLSYNLAGFQNAQSASNTEPSAYFLSGDVRVNEHVMVSAMHTLFMREHNRLCMELPARYPYLAGDDEATYQFARKIVGAIIQSITYYEFLPALLGNDALNPYQGYQEEVNPSISSVFATVAFRFTHNMMPEQLRLGRSRKTLKTRETYFNPRLLRYLGVEPLLEGRMRQSMRKLSVDIPEDLRNLLLNYMGGRAQTFLDFSALTIQRGRDHGLPDYNTVRQAYGLTRIQRFEDMTADHKLQDALEKLYQSVDNIDPWVGAMIESPLEHAQIGALNYVVLKDQFERLRDGDRYWFENDPLLSELRSTLSKIRLSHLLRRNTKLRHVAENVFR